MSDKVQRIRDPIHNLIEFGATSNSDQYQLEHVLWKVIKTRPFQRLRRVKQLGFSELDTRIYPCGLSGWLDLNLDAALLAV